MNGDNKTRIEEIIRNGYDFRFGDYISKGFNLVQKNVGGFVLYALVVFVIMIVAGFIPFIGAIANQFFLSPALMAGGFLVAHKLDKGETAEFGDFFKGFDYIWQLALTAFVTGVILLLSLVPFLLVVGPMGLVEWYMDVLKMRTDISNIPYIPIWSYLLLIPALYLGVSYSWSYLFVIFYKYGFWEAMEASRRMITRNWFIFFAFLIVISLIAAAGAILLCVGLLFTFPAYLCILYSAFADVTRLGSEPGEGEDIERHLVE